MTKEKNTKNQARYYIGRSVPAVGLFSGTLYEEALPQVVEEAIKKEPLGELLFPTLSAMSDAAGKLHQKDKRMELAEAALLKGLKEVQDGRI